MHSWRNFYEARFIDAGAVSDGDVRVKHRSTGGGPDFVSVSTPLPLRKTYDEPAVMTSSHGQCAGGKETLFQSHGSAIAAHER